MNNFLQMNSADRTFVPVCDVEKLLDEIKKSDAPEYVIMTRAEMEELLDDMRLLAIAKERLKNDNGKTYSGEEVYRSLGIELDDLEDMEDVEIE